MDEAKLTQLREDVDELKRKVQEHESRLWFTQSKNSELEASLTEIRIMLEQRTERRP